MRASLIALFFALTMVSVRAEPVPGTFADPQMEARARALQRDLRCLVCQGESIDDSNADLAADLRAVVRAHMAAGESDQQIKDFLVARYGPFILMKPPLESQTYPLWVVPFAILALGLGIVVVVVRRAKARDPNLDN